MKKRGFPFCTRCPLGSGAAVIPIRVEYKKKRILINKACDRVYFVPENSGGANPKENLQAAAKAKITSEGWQK